MIGGHLLHGGDYNPEQWIEYPEILEEDLKLMNKANVNCVTLGVFSWAELEPKEDVYTFEWLEEIIDKLRERKIQVVLATPSGGMPHWLTQKYPETLQVQADGTVNLPGKRHNFCYSSPVMRRKVKQIDRALAQRFGKKENVILWHISNEFGGNFKDSTCHCEKCQKKFREWLKNKYGTLDKLNASWWTGFWSHKYTDFSELTPAMVNEFVSKIIVHRPFELNGTRAVQVEVYLNYIGKFDVPEEPMILSEEELATQKIREEKLEKHRIASRKYMAKYRKRLKEMKKAGTILPENLPAETKGEWL